MASVDVLEVLGNEYNPEILQATYEPHSAQELSDELGVPIATCYRRINELEEAGLLELHDRPLSNDQRRINVYRRNVNEVLVQFDGEECSVSIEHRSELQDKLDQVWRSMSDV